MMNSRNLKKNPNFKIVELMNFASKLDSTICFWASLLMLNIEIFNLIFYIWLFNTTLEVIIKKFNLNKGLLLLLGLWPKYGFSISEHYFGPLYHACTLWSPNFVLGLPSGGAPYIKT